MDVTFQWWVFVKIVNVLFCAYPVYKAFKLKGKSKLWNIGVAVMCLFFFISPIKIDITKTKSVADRSNIMIEDRNREIPPKVVDNSFKDRVNSVKPISKENLK